MAYYLDLFSPETYEARRESPQERQTRLLHDEALALGRSSGSAQDGPLARSYPIDAAQARKLATHTFRRVDTDVVVSVPEDAEHEQLIPVPAPTEDSLRELARQPNLSYLKETLLEEYEEEATED